jgi:hypothetical protein
MRFHSSRWRPAQAMFLLGRAGGAHRLVGEAQLAHDERVLGLKPLMPSVWAHSWLCSAARRMSASLRKRTNCCVAAK